MTKDVLVSISGLHMDTLSGMLNGDEEAIEVLTPGNYYCKNGKHYVIYDEVMEGMHGTIKNRIKITGTDSVEIMKTGLSNTHMVFEKNKKNITYYQTPFGQMLIGVKTRNMEINVTEENIDVSVDYELDINYEPLADCKIKMEIYAKGSDPFASNC
ncbi:DUF1934 domain-containing protein [Faecalicatena contorta]|uniref:Uncharacterized beta-barrel protein YwiB, DUF1934 family n=1 Tax=Faecalicatena contorta TaxID=39482 RepID=A0A315ZXC3_9FIRM|nr:DUF1934 domain-containing protein [Faecalicatena contorta]PWJ50306.1 uncharacterized beta-barrel protein YwiB (DUF1934 family) [Faecalicatena contorta]SUQ13714.1 Uncharacterized beta-barrel protein YwiB, DUF1934 family [Faecalicatena contorta]